MVLLGNSSLPVMWVERPARTLYAYYDPLSIAQNLCDLEPDTLRIELLVGVIDVQDRNVAVAAWGDFCFRVSGKVRDFRY